MNSDLSSVNPPEKKQLLKDMVEDGHSTPESLIDFAQNIVPHVQRALTVESYSQTVMTYLADCALDSEERSIPETVRATCYMNAFKIFKQYPEKFKNSFESLKSNLPTSVKELASDFVSED